MENPEVYQVADRSVQKRGYDFTVELFSEVDNGKKLKFCGILLGYLVSDPKDPRVAGVYDSIVETLMVPERKDEFLGIVDRIVLNEKIDDIMLGLKKMLGEHFKEESLRVPHVFVNVEGYPYTPPKHMTFQEGVLYVY